jgi:hypothetical protein
MPPGPLQAHRVTVRPPLPSLTPLHQLTHYLGIELSKCQASLMSHRHLEFIPGTYEKVAPFASDFPAVLYAYTVQPPPMVNIDL